MTNKKKTMICVALGEVYVHNTLFSVLPFSINSGTRMQELLVSAGWSLKAFLFEKYATKHAIETALSEAIRDASDDEWLLFYFVGHGYRMFSYTYPPTPQELFVPYAEYWNAPQIPRVKDCITDETYSTFVRQFLAGKPNRHFISVLDCCFAEGMINLSSSETNHTLFAAAANNALAFADTKDKQGSFFFKAISLLFSSCRNLTELETQLGPTMKQSALGKSINSPVVRVAQKFSSNYF